MPTASISKATPALTAAATIWMLMGSRGCSRRAEPARRSSSVLMMETGYGNNTTVAANGASNGQGPVPYWRTMQYQWGNGLGNADSDYADVSGTPASGTWSHSITGVTGHRRLHLFAVSQSGRTSFQNSGLSGGTIF